MNKKIILMISFLCLMVLMPLKVSASSVPLVSDSEYLYFDLYYGNVTLSGTSYTGYVLENGVSTKKTGTIDRKIYVYQSNGDSTVWENGLPKYNRVGAPTNSGKNNWAEYITNNTNLNNVITNWVSEANAVGRSATPYRVEVKGANTFDVTIDNLWSSYQVKNLGRTTGGLSFYPNTSTASQLTITMKGDNRFGNIFYGTNSYTNHKCIFNGIDDASVTVVNLATNSSNNYYNSAIGSSDNLDHSRGFVFNSGIIFAGTTYADNCTAIGAGGNGTGTVTINGGTITAVTSTTGTAIGGGIGFSSKGGDATVIINDGTIYAYNFGFDAIPSAAIGGGSSSASDGNANTTVTIEGGTIYAECVGGTAIGGGGSKTKNGGKATINIGGNAVITAKSVEGTYKGTKVNAGASIGGGTGGSDAGKNGGNATVNIYGNARLYTGSIGGGKTNNSTGKIGNATVVISENPIIQGQIVMAAGSSNPCTFTMNGGTIDNGTKTNDFIFLEEHGGAIYVENGTATLNGGTIQNCSSKNGGAIYINGGKYEMYGGTIKSSTANEGGAIYIAKGDFYMEGGTIDGCETTGNGGAGYIEDGNFVMTSGVISNNKADEMGGAFRVANGNVTIGLASCKGLDESHPCPEIIANTALDEGGAISIGNGVITIYCGNFHSNASESNQNSNAIYQSGGEINIEGGNTQSGFTTTGGTLADTRENVRQIIYHSIVGGTDTTIIENVSSGFALVLADNMFTRENYHILGWTQDLSIIDGYMPIGDMIYITDDIDLYAIWNENSEFMVFIPSTIEFINEEEGQFVIDAITEDFDVRENLKISVANIDKKLYLDHDSSVYINYDLLESDTLNSVTNGSVVATFSNLQTSLKSFDVKVLDKPKYSGCYTNTITFLIEYILN